MLVMAAGASSSAKVMATLLLLSLSMQMCAGSAIPIWEFLTRNEKMSFLYSTFAQLVSVHCKATAATSTTPVNQCKHNLLGYGYEKLQTFTDAQLDAFDPYQRGANELIWSSIMRDHASATLVTTRNPLPTPPASSLIILTHQKPQQTTPSLLGSATNVKSNQYPKNPLFETDADNKHKYAMDMDMAYGYGTAAAVQPQVETFELTSQQQQPQQPNNINKATTQQQQKTYLTGPLVFRVRPDGTPVEEDQYRPMPRDDDALETFHVTPTANGNSRSKHRKIATISALKQQHLATLALQQLQLQPPYERVRRQYQIGNLAAQQLPRFGGYFYGKGL